MSTKTEERIPGKYRHYKGNYYTAYCVALDLEGNKFVLYQQCYGDKSFWIRPYNMFFESIKFEDRTTKRFSQVAGKRKTARSKINELIALVENQSILIRNSESEDQYIISQISESDGYVIVHPLDYHYASGYLTEYELAKRLGFLSCRINGEIKYFKSQEEIDTHKSLSIGNNDIEELKELLNPCSIDLQIASSGFLKTRFKLVDPQSVEHVSSATDLWKPVRIHSSKNSQLNYIKIHPGTTILTHTKGKIRIPDDCAGKIEIKSTFARLSLSITYGDFCNPGYYGYFPLEIKNNGRHTIIIHANETMAQLILIPLQGPILAEYSAKATFINENGFDDGTPYSFWRERSIKSLRKENGTQKIIDLSNRLLDVINTENTSDVNAYKDRFNNYFLPYCHKHINKPKYRNVDNSLPDTKKLIMAYIKKEKVLKSLYSIKWLSGILTVICTLLPIVLQLMQNERKTNDSITFLSFWSLVVIAGILLIITIVLFVTAPKTFCTFESIDLDKQINKE